MHWWGKSSKEEMRKSKKGSVVDSVNVEFRILFEDKGGSWRQYTDTVSRNADHRHSVRYQNPSLSHKVSCSRMLFGKSDAQPVPLQEGNPHTTRGDSRIGRTMRAGRERCLLCPFSKPGNIGNTPDGKYIDMEFMTASVSSRCDESTRKTETNCPSSLKLKDESPMPSKQNSRAIMRPSNSLMNSRRVSLSPKRKPRSSNVVNMHIPPISTSLSEPNSSTSSPSVTPTRVATNDPLINSAFGSGHISGPSPVGGDVPEQTYRQHSRYSPECSPASSPEMASPSNSSRVNSDAGASPEFVILWSADRKRPNYRQPLHPVTASSHIPMSLPYSIGTNSQVPQSLVLPDSLPNPGTRWKKGRLLGCGTFGQVYLGFNSENGEMCAMKEVTLFSDDRKSQESAKQLSQEIALLSQLHHPNIVEYYGSEMVGNNMYIYLEYVSGGSIHRVIHNYGPLGEGALKSFTRQILSGLAHLHSKNTVHRDVKGANILLQPGGCVKLADFGMAKLLTRETGPMSFKGSSYWIAPEVIRNANADVSVDIWSLGCTIIEMATGKPPWSQYEEVAALFKIGNTDQLPDIPDFLSEEGKDFIRKCLQRDPSQRPSAAQLLDHPFVRFVPPLERHIPRLEPVEEMHFATNTGNQQSRNPHFLDSGAIHQTRG